MPTLPFSIRARFLVPLASLVATIAALLLPAVASAAVQVEIDNQSGRGDAYVTVVGGAFDVEGINNDDPTPLGNGLTLKINKLINGRIYISYGKGVKVAGPRFSVHPQ